MSTMKELRAIAKERGLRGYFKLKKVELVALLEDNPVKVKRCRICSQINTIDNFISKYTGDIIKVCKICCSMGPEAQEERKRNLFSHLWTRADGSKITDPWEVVDDGKLHKCVQCKKEKEVKCFNLSGGKLNPRLTKKCHICLKENLMKRDDESNFPWSSSFCYPY